LRPIFGGVWRNGKRKATSTSSRWVLTPKNSVLIIIDYQPVQMNSIASMDRQKPIDNIVGIAKASRAFGLTIVHSIVNVKTGLNMLPIPQLRKVLRNLPTVDRTSINSWEDLEFVQRERARKETVPVS
jgi:nicotinamidase-related amidase